MLEEAGWAITAYREEDIEQQSRPGVADDVVTLGHWHLDHEEAFQALNGSLYFDLPMTRHSKIGVDFNHPKDKLPRITVWSRGGLGI